MWRSTMLNKENEKRVFRYVLDNLLDEKNLDQDYIFFIFEEAMKQIREGAEKIEAHSSVAINPIQILEIILHEYRYLTDPIPEEKVGDLIHNQSFSPSLIRTVSEKYLHIFLHPKKKKSHVSLYDPPISTLKLHLSLLLGSLDYFKKNQVQKTLMIDTIQKSFYLVDAILDLLTKGFETEAYSTWRTLHETECTILVFAKYGDPLIKSYVKHMGYGMAYRGLVKDVEENNRIFEKLKGEMREHDLKSKDMRRFIEYGWLYAIDESIRGETFKINFRNGLESMAGLEETSSSDYDIASEISHSSPLLIYSNPRFFLEMTLTRVYESFFRIEEIYTQIVEQSFSQEETHGFLRMRDRNIRELQAIYQIEKEKISHKEK